ncbi:hypothetical protein DPMN_017084 [Dreissena polymorpha]|uniref:Uncharacterized protein n=1 Tax=Dreissena polymorpha TaxID=45954 RepID=A0A9D4S738_DREPO|nr:hypothetical protein DPMN_017084 [Dreissena polymorpha]
MLGQLLRNNTIHNSHDPVDNDHGDRRCMKHFLMLGIAAHSQKLCSLQVFQRGQGGPYSVLHLSTKCAISRIPSGM